MEVGGKKKINPRSFFQIPVPPWFQHIFGTYNFNLVFISFPCFVPFTTPHITYYRSSLHILKYSGLLLFLHVFFLLCFHSFSGNDTVKDTSTSGERDQGWSAWAMRALLQKEGGTWSSGLWRHYSSHITWLDHTLFVHRLRHKGVSGLECRTGGW